MLSSTIGISYQSLLARDTSFTTILALHCQKEEGRVTKVLLHYVIF